MIVTCPNCSTRYSVDAKALGQSGRQVRCASCGHKWHALTTPEAENIVDIAPEPAPEPALENTPENTAEAIIDTEAKEALDAPDSSETDQPDSGPNDAGEDAGAEPAPEAAESKDTPPEKPKPPHQAWRARQEAKARRRRRLIAISAWVGIAASLVLVFALAMVNRVAVVRAMPKTASVFAAMGLHTNRWGVELKALKSTRVQKDGVPVLQLSGTIYNPGKKPRPTPLVRISLQDKSGKEIYAWTIAASLAELPGKATASFRTEVKNPPPAVVNIRFAMTDMALNKPEKPKAQTLAEGAPGQ